MLGVCWYPEQWPRALWAEDARRMKALGLTYVRIGEFAWSRLEPAAGRYNFAWFDAVLDLLHAQGLKVVIGTPTATPPKWLVDAHPEILPVDPMTGRVRGFGSRRHYDFSSPAYLAECGRIVEALAVRYGEHPAVAGWQTDNELGCHDTTLSASPAAATAFRDWCRKRYGEIGALNAAWGNVFWSMEYASFEAVDPPFGAVTETNPSHRLAWRRFASDAVVAFHDAQVAILRRRSPGRFVTHNFIPMHETGVDNHALAAGLDFAAYDNYPLGRTDLTLAQEPPETFRPFMRTGDPDLTGVLLDQTRGLGRNPGFWVMEQQPGPVNWARHNPRPAPGMVRLWTWEAFAHGASVVSYFRWRQAAHAQEQMHAGLRRCDDTPAEAWDEVAQVAEELARLDLAALPAARAPVALMVDVEAQWLSEIERQGAGYDAVTVLVDHYRALRSLGLDVDVIGPRDDLAGYALVVVPGLAAPDPGLAERLRAAGCLILFAPRCGAKTAEFTQPEGLAPGPLRALIDLRVLSVETLRPDCAERFTWEGRTYLSQSWREAVEPGPGVEVLAHADDGLPALLRSGRTLYLTTLTDRAFLTDLIERLCTEAGIATQRLPPTLRLRRRGALSFAFNYAETSVEAPAPAGAGFVLGDRRIGPREVAAWTA